MLNQGMYTPAPSTGGGAIADGRAKRAGVTLYVVPGSQPGLTTTFASTANTDQYAWWKTPTAIVIDQLACEVTAAAGTNFRIGFYAADTDWQPTGAPLADSGNLSSAGIGVKTYTPASPITVPAGRYLSVLNSDGAPTFRAYRGGLTAMDASLGANSVAFDGEIGRAYAAFPTPGTAWTAHNIATSGPSHVIVYRVSTP